MPIGMANFKIIIFSLFSIDHDRVAYKLFFALVYGGISLVMNFSALYFKQLGLESHEIGLVSAVRQICSIVFVPSLCPIVEIKRFRKLVLVIAIVFLVCCITPVGFIFKLSFFQCDNAMLDLNILDNNTIPSCCSGKHVPIEDDSNGPDLAHWLESGRASTIPKSRIHCAFIIICILYGLGDVAWTAIRIISEVSLTESLGINSERFGTSKVYGAVGAAFFTLVVGYVIDQTKETVLTCGAETEYTDYSYCYVVNAVLFSLAAVLVIVVLQLSTESETNSPSVVHWRTYKRTVTSKYIKIYTLSFFYGLFKSSSLTSFAYVYLNEMGGSNLLIGTASSLSTLSSIIAGFFSSFLICKFGFKLIYPCLAATGLSLLMFSFLKTHWFILLANVCQGVTPILELNVQVYIMRQTVSEDQTGTVYSFMTFAVKVGKLITSVVCGYVYGIYGPVVLFRSYAVLCLIAGFITLQIFRSFEIPAVDNLKPGSSEEKQHLLDSSHCATLPPFTFECEILEIQPNISRNNKIGINLL